MSLGALGVPASAGASVLWSKGEGIWGGNVGKLKAELRGPCSRWRKGEAEESGDGVHLAKLMISFRR